MMSMTLIASTMVVVISSFFWSWTLWWPLYLLTCWKLFLVQFTNWCNSTCFCSKLNEIYNIIHLREYFLNFHSHAVDKKKSLWIHNFKFKQEISKRSIDYFKNETEKQFFWGPDFWDPSCVLLLRTGWSHKIFVKIKIVLEFQKVK